MLETLLPRFGVAFTAQPLDLAALFGRATPRVLDIGFGDGEALSNGSSRRSRSFPDKQRAPPRRRP